MTKGSVLAQYFFEGAVEWAWDLRFDSQHVYISGMPWGEQCLTGIVEGGRERNAVTRVLVDAMNKLSDHALHVLYASEGFASSPEKAYCMALEHHISDLRS